MTVKPYKKKLTILEREIVIENDEGAKKPNLRSLRLIKGAVEGLLGRIDGDLEALHRNYKSEIAGSFDCGEIDLASKNWRFNLFSKKIRLMEANGQIENCQDIETNGDRTVMHLSNE